LKEVYLHMDVLMSTREGKLELHALAEKKAEKSPLNFLDALLRHRDAQERRDSSLTEGQTDQIDEDKPDQPDQQAITMLDDQGEEQHPQQQTQQHPQQQQLQDPSTSTEERVEDMDLKMFRYGEGSGATAVTVLLVGKEMYVANCGDSRGVLCRGGHAVELSLDHKPTDPTEFNRIRNAGGLVQSGRVMGDLNLSRALGDMQYKKVEGLKPEEQMVTAYPDLRRFEITDEDEFFVLACDGIWDVKSNQEAVDFIRSRLQQDPPVPLGSICEQLLTDCLARVASGVGTDNMTVVIVSFVR